MPSVADLLSSARRRSFVGRESEIALFERVLGGDLPDYVLLYIYGTGGQGKTTLAKHLYDLCAEKKTTALMVDARDVEPHPVAFMEALRMALGRAPGPAGGSGDVFELLAQLPGRAVLFIDTFEKIAPIDDWVRTDFLPQLPDSILTVITGRSAPSLTWMTDPGWKVLMRMLQLSNFSHAESEDYLRRRKIPEEKIRPILDFTHGHPLALSVVADIYEQYPDKNFSPEESPDVVRALLQLFVRQVPSPMHRAALELSALVNLLTESLLAEVMGLEDAGELFNWMCGLSFISIGKEGIYPHDIAREALSADIKWRHPDWNAELHNRVRHYYHRKLKEGGGEAQRKVLFELIYLHRQNPVVKPFFDWREGGSFWVDAASANDLPALRDIIGTQEGPESLAAFEYWHQHPAAQIWVWRDALKKANAFVLKIDTQDLKPDHLANDPAVQRVVAYQQKHLNLRPGDQMSIFRLWMAKDTHQQVSPLQSSMFLTIVQYYFTPGLAVSMLSVVQPEFWKAVLSYADLMHVTELDFAVQEVPFGWYMHDWRVRPPLVWLDLLGKREVDASAGADEADRKMQAVVLNEADFGEAVGEALRHFHNNNTLINNVLLRSKLVIQAAGGDPSDAQRVGALKQVIQDVLKDIEESPIDGKYHRVLYRSFINPVGSQEKTADFLNMSFSTYRRYLQAGVMRLAELMWNKEFS
jgi:hypothetical protein